MCQKTIINTLSVPCRSLNSIIWSESGSSIQSHIGWTKSDHKTGSLCWLQAHYKSTDHIWSSTKLNRVQHGHLTCYEPAAKRQAVRMCVQKLWKNVNCQNDYVQNQHLTSYTHCARGALSPGFLYHCPKAWKFQDSERTTRKSLVPWIHIS